MPFDTTGTYTPPLGSENAAPGQIIRSATWNSIFTDIANALTQLGQGQFVQNPRIITSVGSILVAAADTLILIQASVPTITLPNSTTKISSVTIIGNAAGIFSSNNSTIATTAAQTVDGLASGVMVLATDYQSVTFIPLAAGGWVTK